MALLASGGVAVAHWLKPDEIVAGLRQNVTLRQTVGLRSVSYEPEFPRLLIIKVSRKEWDSAATSLRLELAAEWFETWRHNVDGGIVAVLDAASDANLVNYDAFGRPRLEKPAREAKPVISDQ